MPRCAKRVRAMMGVVWGLMVASTCIAQAGGPMSSSRPASAAAAAQAGAASAAGFDVQSLFASSCGWCHSGGGRLPGKGPQLMNTTLSDAELTHRIKAGKPGAMPAFASSFNDEQLKAIVAYIRGLKPEGATK